MTLDTQTCVVTGASRGIDRGSAAEVREESPDHSPFRRFAAIEDGIGTVRSVAGLESDSISHTLATDGGMEG